MLPPLTCLVVDDEPPACKLLERFIDRVDSLRWIGTCTNAIQALDVIRRQQPDIVLLDIQMPELTGLELIGSLPPSRPQIVLTTAFPDYALDGFDYDVTDYLLKPIRFDRFLRAINKVYGRKGVAVPDEVAGKPSSPETPPGPAVTSRDSALWVKVNKQQIRLPLKDIVFVESMKDYTHVNLLDKSLRVHQPLSAIEELLTDDFLRISRSFIVRCSAITGIKANAVELITKQQLPIGITYRELVRERLKQYTGPV